MSTSSNPSTKILSGILIGSAIGLTCSLIDSTTRKTTMQRIENMKDFSNRFMQNYKENPDQVKKEMKDTINNTSDSMKNVWEDSQTLYKHIHATVKERSNDLREMAEDFRQLYFQSMRHYQKITHTLKDTKEHIIDTADMEEEKMLPMTMEKRELVNTEQQKL